MKKSVIVLAATAMFGVSCKKITDVNQNPNQPTNVTPSVLLSAALSASAGSVGTNFISTPRWMGYWARSGNFITTPPVEDYQLDVSFADRDWQSLYNTLSKYNNLEKAAKANPTVLSFYIGVAKTMKALHFSTLVDAFNNVPYTQAFNLNAYPAPKYDDAAAIYADLVNQCDSAVTYFDKAKAYYDAGGSTAATDDQYDIMFGRGAGGSDKGAADIRMDNWVKFANTVKLRILLTGQGATGAGIVSAELAKTTANGRGYLTAATSATVNPGYNNSSTTRLNPFYGIFLQVSGATSNGYAFNRANQYAINFYKNTGDPARAQLVYAQVGNILTGNYDGDANSQSNAVTAGVGTGLLKQPGQDQLILSDFESLFWQAEAVQEGYLPGDKNALVKAAIEQNFVYLGSTASAADAYVQSGIGNPLVDASTGLQAIMTQKWIALNGINWEQAYTDYRRTGFPAPDGINFGLTHAPQPITHNGKPTIPYRYLYPQSEVSTNGKNIPVATAYTPIFWDKREQ